MASRNGNNPERAAEAARSGAPPKVRVEADFAEEYPGAEPFSVECAQSIVRIADLMVGEFNRRLRADFDLSASAGNVLAIIDGAGEPITPGVVAERAIVTSATVTSMLDTLEKRGLVGRLRHATDRRKVLVELTDAGRAAVDRFLPGIYGLQTRVMAGLSPAERRQLLAILDKVLAQTHAIASEVPEPLGGVRHVPERLRRA